LFSLAEEAEILKEIEEDALLDKILINKDIKTIIEKKRISPFQMIIYGIYLKGMVGVKKVPRRHHPKRN
jgi:hypothetical protein